MGRRRELISQAEFGRRIGVTGRHVYRLAAEEGFPRDRTAKPPNQVVWPEANHWYIEYRERLVRERQKPTSIDESRAAKLEAEARIAQMEAARVEGALIRLEDHEAALAGLLEVLRSGLTAAPGTWAPRLVGCRTIAEASTRLEELTVELVVGLEAEVDGLDEELQDVA